VGPGQPSSMSRNSIPPAGTKVKRRGGGEKKNHFVGNKQLELISPDSGKPFLGRNGRENQWGKREVGTGSAVWYPSSLLGRRGGTIERGTKEKSQKRKRWEDDNL